VVLQAAPVEVGDRVTRRVVAGRALDEGEVQAAEPGVREHREVGVVRQHPVHLDHRRVATRVRHRVVEQVHEPRVVPRRLEHQRRTADPTCLEVQHHATPAPQRVLPHEGVGAEQTVLLAVGDQQHDVVAQSVTTQCPHRLEHGGHRGAVVGRAGPHRRRVVVRGEDHRARRVGARQRGDDVVDLPERGQPVGRVDTDRALHLHRQARRT
jgi:hypothetical protein